MMVLANFNQKYHQGRHQKKIKSIQKLKKI